MFAKSKNINYKFQITFPENSFEILENGAVSSNTELFQLIWELASSFQSYKLENTVIYFDNN